LPRAAKTLAPPLSLQRSPKPLAGFKGPTSKGREEREGRDRKGAEGKEGKGRGGGRVPPPTFE